MLRVLVYGVLPFVVAAALAKGVLAPLLVRRAVARWFQENTNADLSVGWATVGFRDIRLHDLSLSDRAGTVVATADHVAIAFDRPLLGFGAPGIASLRVVRPDVTVVLDADGRFNLGDLLRRPEGAPGQPDSSVSALELPPALLIEAGMLRFRSPFLHGDFGEIDAPIQVLPDRFDWTSVQGSAFGGRASLFGSVGRSGNPHWTVQINLDGADVRQMTRGTSIEDRNLSGRLNGFLVLERGPRDDPRVIGAGWIDIDDGRLLELPVLLSVLNVLRLGAPGDAEVTACRTDFRLYPDRLHFDRFYVLTRGIGLIGSGDVLLRNQALDLDFMPRLVHELPPGLDGARRTIQPATDLISQKLLFNIKVRGTWTRPTTRLSPIPAVTQPLLDIVDWMLQEARSR